MNFAKYSPCLYEKEILCSECKTHPGCDMRAGRELHRKCYEDGYRSAVKNCWKKINSLIVTGELTGNGWDKTAERNGLILATNAVLNIELNIL